jgi:hypothetical protein
MDEATVAENNFITKDLTVKGTAVVEGDLVVTGSIPENSPMYVKIINNVTNNVRSSLDQNVFKGYADLVFSQIKENGLDLNKITMGGQEVVSGSNLSNSITYSNLQHVGVLRDLQTSGESLLSQTLYTTNKRVGINTIEPSQALSLWDQEIEIGFGKQSSNTAVIETPRNQRLVLSSNGRNNIILESDGSVEVQTLKVGSMTITTSATPPSTNQPKGSIVLNENPTLGGPMGWVSLGDARWANFGVID